MMKIEKQNNKFFNKSGRLIAEIKEGKCYIAQKDFRRAARQIRELFDNKVYFVII